MEKAITGIVKGKNIGTFFTPAKGTNTPVEVEAALGKIFKYCTVKPVLSGHWKIDKTKVLKTDGSLMHVESTVKSRLSERQLSETTGLFEDYGQSRLFLYYLLQ